MLSSAWLFDRLFEAAAISLLLFALGSLAVLVCRQPVRRVRIIMLILTGSVLAPLLNLLPGLPHWSLPVIRPTAPPFQAERAEHHAVVDAPVQTADLQSSGTSFVSVANPVAGLDEPTGQAEAAIEDQEPSSEPLNADDASIPVAKVNPSSSPRPWETPASAHTAVASIPQSFNLARWIVGSYLAGVAVLTAWWGLGIAALRRLLRTARPAPAYCRRLLREIAGPAGDHVQLLVSSRALQPFTFGWYRPVIVLPEEMTRLSSASCDPQPEALSSELNWSLAHEWSHVARGDVRIWSFAGLVRLVHFYQPLCWWLRHDLRLCQDYLADAAAAQRTSPETYAEFLAKRGVGRPLAVGLGIAGPRSDLYRRIVMLVEDRRSLEADCPRGWTVAAGAGAIALVVLAATCTSQSGAIAAADHPADSGIRERSEVRHAPSLNSDDNNEPREKTRSNGDRVAFSNLREAAGQGTGLAETVEQIEKLATVEPAKIDSDAATLQKLLDGMFARATAITSGRFEATVLRTHDSKKSAFSRRFVVSGGNWSRTTIPNPPLADTGSDAEQLEIVRAGRHFSLSRPGPSGTAEKRPPRLTINWPESVKNADEPGAGPPLQAGSIWYRSTVPYLREHSSDARLGGTARVNDCDTQIIEWTIPAVSAKAAFVKLNNLLSGGGIYRVYVSPALGDALAKIEFIDRFGTPQAVFNSLEFQERAPGIYIPKYVRIEEADESWLMEIIQATNVNESIDERDITLKIPPRTHVIDNRPHRGEERGIGDERIFPLRSFTTGAEYPDGLPAAMLEEMDRDAVSPEEFAASQRRAQQSTNKPSSPAAWIKPSTRPETTARKTAEDKSTFDRNSGEKNIGEKLAASVKDTPNLPDKKRLVYDGKNFSQWRDLLLTDLDPQSQLKALQAVGALGANGYGEEAAAVIAEVLKTATAADNNGVYFTACSELVHLGAPGIPVLESELRNRDRSLQSEAVNAILRLAGKTDAVISAMLEASRDDDTKIRRDVFAALAQYYLAASGVADTLTAALRGDERSVRSAILDGAKRSTPSADKAPDLLLRLLNVALHDEDDSIRGQAAYLFCIRAPATSEHAALLRQVLLRSSSDCISKFLELFIHQRTIPSPALAENVVPTLFAIIESSDWSPTVNAHLVESSLRALSMVAREKAALPAIPILIKGVRGEIPTNTERDRALIVRLLFAEPLGRIGPAAVEALPALKELQEAELKSQKPRTPSRDSIESVIRRIEGRKK